MASEMRLRYKVNGRDHSHCVVATANDTVDSVIVMIRDREGIQSLDTLMLNDVPLDGDRMICDVHGRKMMYTVTSKGVPMSKARPLDDPPGTDQHDNDKLTIEVFTTLSFSRMTKPIVLNVPKNATVRDINPVQLCGPLANPADVHFRFYAPDSTEIEERKIRTYFATSDKIILFGVPYKDCQAGLMNESFTDLTDISDKNISELLSPFAASTEMGICQMSVLLTYLQNDGEDAEELGGSIAAITGFAPFAVAMWKLIHEQTVTGIELITITNTLRSVCDNITRSWVRPSEVLDYTIKCAAFALLVDGERLDVRNGKWVPRPRRHLPELTHARQFNRVFDMVKSLKPLTSSEIRGLHRTAIIVFPPCIALAVCGRNSKDRTLAMTFDVVNPLGKVRRECLVIERVQDRCANKRVDELPVLLPPSDVSQIVVFCMESSVTMNQEDRYIWAEQFFAQCLGRWERAGNVRVGLIYYSDYPHIVFEPGEDFRHECYSSGSFYHANALCDTIGVATDLLKKHADRYPRAKKRIIALCHSDDAGSQMTTHDTAQKLVKQKIVLDGITLGNSRELCTMCILTGGLCFNTLPSIAGLGIADCDAFINIRVRDDMKQPFDNIDEDVFGDVYCGLEFATTSTLADKSFRNVRRHMECQRSDGAYVQDSGGPNNGRHRKILTELRNISNTRGRGVSLDVLGGVFDKWLISFEVRRGTPGPQSYDLFIDFPKEYPYVAPKVWFVDNIPHHISVSSTGRVCHSILYQDYNGDVTIMEIIGAVRDMLYRLRPGDANQILQWFEWHK